MKIYSIQQNKNKGYYIPTAAEAGMLNNRINTAFRGNSSNPVIPPIQSADVTQFKRSMNNTPKQSIKQKVLNKVNDFFTIDSIPVFDQNNPLNSEIPWIRSFLF